MLFKFKINGMTIMYNIVTLLKNRGTTAACFHKVSNFSFNKQILY
jgi:hypothetical protein